MGSSCPLVDNANLRFRGLPDDKYSSQRPMDGFLVSDDCRMDLPKPYEVTGRQRAHSMSKVMRIKEDINRKLKNTLLTRRHPPKSISNGERHRRRISVDMTGFNRRRTAQSCVYEELGLDDWNLCDRNLSTNLKLTSLRDGLFSATFHLEALPSGDLIIRVRCYKLQIIVKNPDAELENSSRTMTYAYYGYIEIPIYVDYSTLEFEMEAGEASRITITGRMKGCLNPVTPKVSPSSSSDMSPKQRLIDSWHSRLCGLGGSEDGGEDTELTVDDNSFRGRCYTR